MKHTKIDFLLIFVVIIYNLSLALFAFLWLFTGYLHQIKIDVFTDTSNNFLNVQEKLFSFFVSGVLGGAFYCLRALYKRLSDAYTPENLISKENLPDPTLILNIKVWLFWYLYRPIQSGILSIVVICLFNSGFISINNIDADSISKLYFQVGVGFLIGFGTHDVINKIEEIIKVIFANAKYRKEKSSQEECTEKIEKSNKAE